MNSSIVTTHLAIEGPHSEILGGTEAKIIQSTKIMEEIKENLKDKDLPQLHIKDAQWIQHNPWEMEIFHLREHTGIVEMVQQEWVPSINLQNAPGLFSQVISNRISSSWQVYGENIPKQTGELRGIHENFERDKKFGRSYSPKIQSQPSYKGKTVPFEELMGRSNPFDQSKASRVNASSNAVEFFTAEYLLDKSASIYSVRGKYTRNLDTNYYHFCHLI
ncbi:hypothetical protein GcM1_190025 [Golovinomyces cichoracearum]|uniref:Uncharacterized protein n=1 Tax=Golovinomyces cichoracearum TaxID=62708 RepID=A0A420J1X3_9PEZI|nr:hypothetical protein GcM1_190025 [Golovinomyces cichoracearum]